MVEVGVARSFTARHRLVLPGGSVHEDAHDYRVEAVVRGEAPAENGMLLDLDRLGGALAACVAELDGSDLDALAALAGKPTTVEIVADHIWRHVRAGLAESGGLAGLRVTLFESGDAWAAVDRVLMPATSAAPFSVAPGSPAQG